MNCSKADLAKRLLALRNAKSQPSELDGQLKQLDLCRDPQNGIGKVMGNNLYVHKSCESALPYDALNKAKDRIPKGFKYDIVKFDRAVGSFTFIHSPDWDTADEPTCGDSVLVRKDGSISSRKAASRTQIYHHKWQFVRDDYPGFDVEASKRRSLSWRGLAGVDSQKIGYKDHWERNVVPRIAASPDHASRTA